MNLELITFVIDNVVRCDECIAFHAYDGLKSDTSHVEIVDAIEVAF